MFLINPAMVDLPIGTACLVALLGYAVVFIGLITFLIRNFASMNEGMSFAILLGNLMTPWFNAWGHQTPLGYKKPQKAAKGGKE